STRRIKRASRQLRASAASRCWDRRSGRTLRLYNTNRRSRSSLRMARRASTRGWDQLGATAATKAELPGTTMITGAAKGGEEEEEVVVEIAGGHAGRGRSVQYARRNMVS
ncbi:hypothetical protein EV182_002088, partial [Spiromyces aspiralis]